MGRGGGVRREGGGRRTRGRPSGPMRCALGATPPPSLAHTHLRLCLGACQDLLDSARGDHACGEGWEGAFRERERTEGESARRGADPWPLSSALFAPTAPTHACPRRPSARPGPAGPATRSAPPPKSPGGAARRRWAGRRARQPPAARAGRPPGGWPPSSRGGAGGRGGSWSAGQGECLCVWAPGKWCDARAQARGGGRPHTRRGGREKKEGHGPGRESAVSSLSLSKKPTSRAGPDAPPRPHA